MLWYFMDFIAKNRNKSLEIFKLENNCWEIMFYQGFEAWVCRGCWYACHSHRSLSETMHGGRSGNNGLVSYIGKGLISHPSVITLLLVSAFKAAGFFFFPRMGLHRWTILELLKQGLENQREQSTEKDHSTKIWLRKCKVEQKQAYWMTSDGWWPMARLSNRNHMDPS